MSSDELLSPDGTTVLIVSNENEPGAIERNDACRFWDAATGRQIGPPLRKNQGAIYAIAYAPDSSHVAFGGEYGTIQLFPAPPPPIEGDVTRIVLWTQVITGMEIDGGGIIRVLDGSAWEQRNQRLQSMGGPPVP